ncbi:hypothetical protein PISMIDRAFT_588312 [Pisolithus microcarpus 441]|uniref:Uncharacterized protein n=1 Tax=Pisolithus microcarpus 441 TaxID=765257 RepID=A0A0D0A2A0_9AGAM|nr:hypothetical protein PISMIDRAFT_588312 [Pisolithus microcarpus 441]
MSKFSILVPYHVFAHCIQPCEEFPLTCTRRGTCRRRHHSSSSTLDSSRCSPYVDRVTIIHDVPLQRGLCVTPAQWEDSIFSPVSPVVFCRRYH